MVKKALNVLYGAEKAYKHYQFLNGLWNKYQHFKNIDDEDNTYELYVYLL